METKLTGEQKEILFGILLGDAHLETQNQGLTFRLKVEQSLKHQAYLNHLYGIFQNYVKTPPKKRIIEYTTGKQSTNVRFSTVATIKFRFFGKQFYKNTKKIIPKLIHRWLTPRALAYWFMDDGSMKSIHSKGVLLNTQNFSHAEVLQLCDVLKQNFNLSCWPRKQKKTHIKFIFQVQVMKLYEISFMSFLFLK